MSIKLDVVSIKKEIEEVFGVGDDDKGGSCHLGELNGERMRDVQGDS